MSPTALQLIGDWILKRARPRHPSQEE
jgi:hypothetical protein